MRSSKKYPNSITLSDDGLYYAWDETGADPVGGPYAFLEEAEAALDKYVAWLSTGDEANKGGA